MTHLLPRIVATAIVMTVASVAHAKTWDHSDVTVVGDVQTVVDSAAQVTDLVVVGDALSIVAPFGTVTDGMVKGRSSATSLVEISYNNRTFFAEAFAFSFSTQELLVEGVSASRRTES